MRSELVTWVWAGGLLQRSQDSALRQAAFQSRMGAFPTISPGPGKVDEGLGLHRRASLQNISPHFIQGGWDKAPSGAAVSTSRPVRFRLVRFCSVLSGSVRFRFVPFSGFGFRNRGFGGAFPGTPALFPDGGVVLVPDELGPQHLIDHPGAAGEIGFRAAAHKAHGGQHCLAHLLVRQQLQHFQLVIEQGNVFFLGHNEPPPAFPRKNRRPLPACGQPPMKKCRITRPTPLRLPGTTGRGSA